MIYASTQEFASRIIFVDTDALPVELKAYLLVQFFKETSMTR